MRIFPLNPLSQTNAQRFNEHETNNNCYDMNNILTKEFTNKTDWRKLESLLDSIRLNRLLEDNDLSYQSISQYHLYLMLKQKKVPVPPNVIKSIFKLFPALSKPGNENYNLNVIIAFENQASLPETLFQLLHLSSDPIKLTYSIMQHLINRSSNTHNEGSITDNAMSFVPDMNLQVLIHESFLEALYCHDNEGNVLLHQACKTCVAPRIVRLIIEGMMNDIGWWCVVGCNDKGQSPFQLALLSRNSFQHTNAVLDELLTVIPVLDLPSLECIVRNELLHISIRTGNTLLSFKLLKTYSCLINFWSTTGTLPLHDICQFGTSDSIGQFLDEFDIYLGPQMLITTTVWPKFLPLQIACMNPYASVFIILRILDFYLSPHQSNLGETIRKYGLLHLAAAASNVKIAQYLSSKTPEALVSKNFQHFGSWGNEGPIPIFFACVSGSSEMIEFLFNEGKKYKIRAYQHGGLIDNKTCNPLHPIVAACSNHRIAMATMQKLLIESGISSKWICNTRLLHCAAFEGNIEVASALVNHVPRALFCIDEEGSLPLHDACCGGDPNTIEYLFLEQTKLSCTRGSMMVSKNLCGMFHRNINRVSPWDLVCEMLETLFIEGEENQSFYSGVFSVTMLALILDAGRRHYGQFDTSTSRNNSKSSVAIPLHVLNAALDPRSQETIFPVHHSAIKNIASITVLENIIVQNLQNCDPLQLDKYGRTALHLAMETQKEGDDWCGIIHHLLCDEEHGSRECAYIQDSNSRYLLHTAAANGLSWNRGLSLIVDANKGILDCKDKVTDLYPFMLAASGKRSDVNAIYELLRRSPGSLSSLTYSDTTATAIAATATTIVRSRNGKKPLQNNNTMSNNDLGVTKMFTKCLIIE